MIDLCRSRAEQNIYIKLTEYIKHGARWLLVLVMCSHYKSELFDSKTQALKNPLDVNQAGFGAECFGIDGLFHFAGACFLERSQNN